MRQYVLPMLFSGLVGLTLCSPAAAQLKPIVLFSTSPMQELLADGEYVDELVSEQKQALWPQAPAFLQGIDLTKPIGGGIFTDAGGFAIKPIGFIPVSNFEQAVNRAGIFVGGAQDGTNGIKIVGPVHIKKQEGYAFLAQDEATLSELPTPEKVLGGFEQNYDLSLTVFLENLPPQLKMIGLGMLRQSIDESTKQLDDESDEQFKLRKEMTQQQLDSMTKTLEQLETISIGISIDQSNKQLMIDYMVKALPGTDMAEMYGQMATAKSRFSSMLHDDAVFSMNSAVEVNDPEQIEQTVLQIESGREEILAEIEESDKIQTDEDRQAFKELVREGSELFIAFIKQGSTDFAVTTLQASDKSFQTYGGVYCEEAREVEAYVKKLVKMEPTFRRYAKAEAEEEGREADFPEIDVNLDSETFSGATIHEISFPPSTKEKVREVVQALMGPDPKFYLAFAENGIWFASGSGVSDALKSLIKTTQSDEMKEVSPFQLTVKTAPVAERILYLDQFSEEEDADPEVTQKIMEQLPEDGGLVKITTKPAEGGLLYRTTASEEVVSFVAYVARTISEKMGEAMEEVGDEIEADDFDNF
ncbi:Hypothetical protein PBC10988_31650 [Planctomycetales bacterium 10988]|nr:Hypothetical protein PBC10988_31650 [Planctomycetales bacterium 10988]